MADLRIVSEQSNEAIKRKRAEERLDWPLRELAANLLRIVRGAGKPHELLLQMQKVIDVSVEYQRLHGHWPSPELITSILRMPDEVEKLHARIGDGSITEADFDRWEKDGSLDRTRALHEICRGSLQKIASAMLGQSPQEASGESDIHNGIRAIEEIREARRRALGTTKPRRRLKPEPRL